MDRSGRRVLSKRALGQSSSMTHPSMSLSTDPSSQWPAGEEVPVIVFPQTLQFIADDPSTHTRIIRLYNPFTHVLKFKVLSTAPRKYKVIDPEGVVKSHCMIDIYFRHTQICQSQENVQDKFRIEVTQPGDKKVIGKKDLVSVLLPTADKTPATADDDFESLPASLAQGSRQHEQSSTNIGNRARATGPSWLMIATIISCLVVLLVLPGDYENNPRLPKYLHIAVTWKFIAAYVLGMITIKLMEQS